MSALASGQTNDGVELRSVSSLSPTVDVSIIDVQLTDAARVVDSKDLIATVPTPTNGHITAAAAATDGGAGDEPLPSVTTAEDELAEEFDGRFARCVAICQSAVRKFWRRHRKHILIAFKIILVAAYFAYFGYAMYYTRLGNEAAVRLLWVTCVVVTCLVIKMALGCCRRHNVRMPTHWTLWTRCSGRQRTINWVILGALFLFIIIFVIVDIVVVSKNPYNLVSLSGLLLCVIVLFVASNNPAKVNWQTVLWGISLQFIFALLVLRWAVGYSVFQWLGDRVTEFYAYSDAGAEFVFGATFTDHFFAFKVLPVVIFFSSIISLLSYGGVVQFVVRKISWVFQVTMATSAAESLVAAGNIFLSQTEAPLMIRYLFVDLTNSELSAVMTAGFATIAGSVMGAYIAFGVPANHLLAASVMSAPAALACAKLIYPETQHSNSNISAIDKSKMNHRTEINVIDAAARGASNAISLVANIAANLIAFLAILQFINATLTWFGQLVGIKQLTFQIICSYVLWPLAVVMGTDISDCRAVAEMIGTKTFLNEFVAYTELGVFIANRRQLDDHVAHNGTWHWVGDDVVMTSSSSNDTVLLSRGVMSERSMLIATYALCGFSNFGSIGIQLGALGAMAPSRRNDLASMAFITMIAGNVACFMTACIAGLFFQGQL